jgi:uncharacterized protein (TIGR00297 family)
VGVIGAAVVAVAARRSRTLSTSGALASAVVGTLSLAAGWSWGILLLAHFLAASLLSKIGERRKAARIGAIVEKGDQRDATQVIANGAVYVLAALAYVVAPSQVWYAIGVGALAASAADTWATEVGTLAGGEPISIVRWQISGGWHVSAKRVPPGTSGGITLVGTLAGVAGALFIAAGAALAMWPVSFAAAALGGLAGSLADSVVGATLQARNYCDVCGALTERAVHACGGPTRHFGGIRGFDNDAVNVVCSGVGALVALLLS